MQQLCLMPYAILVGYERYRARPLFYASYSANLPTLANGYKWRCGGDGCARGEFSYWAGYRTYLDTRGILKLAATDVRIKLRTSIFRR
jgi:hypothetical protein